MSEQSVSARDFAAVVRQRDEARKKLRQVEEWVASKVVEAKDRAGAPNVTYGDLYHLASLVSPDHAFISSWTHG